jgi:nucleoside-diphosphate-sugar epimerase
MLGYHPKIAVEEGIDRFVAWYKEYRVSLDLDKM